MNGRISGELKGELPPEQELLRRLRLLDGRDRYSLILWAVPAGTTFDRVDLRRWPREYMQVAGGPARMTVEVRRPHGEGFDHFVIGRAPDPGHLRTEVIEWDGCETLVQPNEVFDVQGAGQLFVEYFRTGDVRSTYSLRNLDL
jgi:hypothetical protein